MSSNQLEGISIPIISYQHDNDRLNAVEFEFITNDITNAQLTSPLISPKVERDQNLEFFEEDNVYEDLISDSRSRPSNNYLFDDLWKQFSELTNLGYEFSQISEKIKEIIKNQNQENNKIFTILNETSNLSLNFQCLFGFFYLMGIGTDAYPDTAFEIFKKKGIGVTKDIGLAKEWYKKAADNGNKYSKAK
ncbi:17459_t:CDS:2 [Gigaspora margarita]|uniref:17459_t:CDS:1 n=1 Tax=Gigaspora margarita TaxID=4874 RepID=A0ABM8W673_GIGMA|nr:17459_t:CDS:2 [Gigaspora margarita]